MPLCAASGRYCIELSFCMVRRILYIVSVVFLCGCEVIHENERLIPVEPADPQGERTHLLIEYTGFRCVNCPTATEMAESLSQLYGEQLIVVAMHPASNPFTQGNYDYTCPEADICYQFMGGTASTPFPVGAIDMALANGDYFLNMSEWPSRLQSAIEKETSAPFLAVQTQQNEQTVQVTVQVCSDIPTSCRLAVWLIEDNVSGVQAMPDGTVNTAYLHRHMLRTTSDGSPWGKSIEINKTLSVFQTEITVPEICVPEHCSVVALLLDPNDYHVLQVKQTDI